MLNYKAISAIAAAALVAGVAVFIVPAMTQKVEASTPVAATKGDRLDIRSAVGPTCSQQAWPYYETRCLRDVSQNASRARPVRLVSTDRLPG